MITLKEKTNEIIDLPCLKLISIGRAYEILRGDMQHYLKKARKELGFEYCRFHALFHDDMDVVYEDENGQIRYHWHHIDKVYDFLISIGMKPFVELNPMPAALASGSQELFFYKMNVTPPKDMKLWYDLIYNFTKHVTERYGEKEVSTWFFEVWNEPNLKAFWSGTKEEYFELYKYAAFAVKEVNPKYRVGGPATAVADWITDTIDFCYQNQIPLDFISTHIYPQDEYCRYESRETSPYELGQYYVEMVQGVKQAVEKSPMPKLPIYWTEFNTLSCDCAQNVLFLGNTALDRLFAASCIVHNLLRVRNECDGISYWTLSDIFEEHKMAHLPFSGTYGLLTIHGIKKASYNAFKLLKKMRGSVVDTEFSDELPLGCGILAAEESGVYRILLWNHVFPEVLNQPIWNECIRLNVRSSEYVVEQATITQEQGSPYEAWTKMGRPDNLTPFEEEFLNACGEMKYTLPDFDDVNGSISVSVKPDEVVYLEIRPKDHKAAVSKDYFNKEVILRTY